jgi:hypothetical protein
MDCFGGMLVMMRIVCGTLATLLLVATTAAYADPEAQYLECIRNKNSKACQNALKQREKEKKPEDILRNTYFRYMTVKSCFDRRQKFKQVYINNAEMTKAKEYMSTIDKKLNLPTKDQMWGQAHNLYKKSLLSLLLMSSSASQEALQLCRAEYDILESSYKEMFCPMKN